MESAGTPFAGKRVELPCLDLAAAQTEDQLATGPVIAFSFGNRCMHEAHVDLSSVRAVGRYADGTRELHAYDPHHELHSMQIDAWWMGHEEIEYLADDGSTPTALCIDVGRVEPSATATEHWLCFGTWDLGGAESFGKSDAAPPDASAVTNGGWPMSEVVDAAVTSIPSNDNVSIDTVGAYLASHFHDQRWLIKAIHDYVALRLSYDDHTADLIDHKQWELIESQEAEDVFMRRTAVCAGYAKLMTALGKAAGVEIAYITGYARDATTTIGSIDNHAHAWNAAQIDGHWYLIDTTWDHRSETARDRVASTYLFTPPALFAASHFPGEANWQLMAPALTLDDFVRQASFGGGR